MLEDVRRNVMGFVEAGMAAVSGAITPTKARDMARSLAEGEGPKQVNRVAQELLEWSQRSREWISEAVAREVKRQLSAVGIATKDDLDALRKRVRELERASGAKAGGAKKSSARAAARSGSGARKASTGSKTRAGTKGPTPTAAPDPAEKASGLGDPGPSAP
jgi:polyhydroxyalkanoate synthesis regulator phasin